VGSKAQIVEVGSGASEKVRILLDSLESPQSYLAIDISDEFMRVAAARIKAAYPHIEVAHICADFTVPLPDSPIADIGNVLGFFPGLSIGNMVAEDAIGLLTRSALVSPLRRRPSCHSPGISVRKRTLARRG
jgi:uncharacterized SAM-dependent methyltransferase